MYQNIAHLLAQIFFGHFWKAKNGVCMSLSGSRTGPYFTTYFLSHFIISPFFLLFLYPSNPHMFQNIAHYLGPKT